MELRFDRRRRESDATKHAPLGGVKCAKIIYIHCVSHWGARVRVDAHDGGIVCGERNDQWTAESSVDDDANDDATGDGVGRDASGREKRGRFSGRIRFARWDVDPESSVVWDRHSESDGELWHHWSDVVEIPRVYSRVGADEEGVRDGESKAWIVIGGCVSGDHARVRCVD